VKQILILGGGFGGVYTALHLERLLSASEADVTLVSRDNYFLMTPLLFEAGSGILEPRHAVNPIRTMFRRVNFVQAEIQAIDLDARKVIVGIEGGGTQTLSYDQLVLALGGMTNTAMIPGSEAALTFKTLGDAIFLRNHAIQRFERADVELDPEKKRAALTFVFVGAGLVGIELVGEMTEFLPIVARLYRNVRREELRFVLIEAGVRVAPEFEEPMSRYIEKVLRNRGVSIRDNTFVDRIEPTRVHLRGGEIIDAETIVLAAGVTPSPLVKDLPLEKTKRGAIVVEPSMQVKDRPEVWALGDCAAIPSPSGKPYPALAQHALREAKVLARNIASSLRGEDKPDPFVYETKGLLAALGHYNGVGRIYKLRIKGFLAWWVWRSYYLFQMPQWSRRIRIMIDWSVALLFRNDVVQLDQVREADARRQHDRASKQD
jgi:NADH:ubiquinone reductase (H+-translocating)